jgi:hypothetical protein
MHTVTHYKNFVGNVFLSGCINPVLLFNFYYQKHVLQAAFGISHILTTVTQQKSSGGPESNDGLQLLHRCYWAPKINSNICKKFNIIHLECNIHM